METRRTVGFTKGQGDSFCPQKRGLGATRARLFVSVFVLQKGKAATKAEEGEDHGWGRAPEADVAAGALDPAQWEGNERNTGAVEAGEKLDIEAETGVKEIRLDGDPGRSGDQFEAALGVGEREGADRGGEGGEDKAGEAAEQGAGGVERADGEPQSIGGAGGEGGNEEAADFGGGYGTVGVDEGEPRGAAVGAPGGEDGTALLGVAG